MERSKYDVKAEEIAATMGLVVKAAWKGDRCPAWRKPCDHSHGNRYRVTLRFTGKITEHPARGSLTFDFWNSWYDVAMGRRPTYYDILACVASDASMPTNPDELVDEFGPMTPSQAIRAARFAQRLQGFFNEDELSALSDIDGGHAQ